MKMIEEKPPVTTVTRKTVGEPKEHPYTMGHIFIIVLIVVIGAPTFLIVGHALPLLDSFFNGMKPLMSYLGFSVGIALIAFVGLSIWYVYGLFRVDIKRRTIEARKFQVDPQSGNYDAYFDEDKRFLAPSPGVMIPPVSAHYAPQWHFINKVSTKNDTEVTELALGPVNTNKPSVEDLASKVERNSLQVNLGRSIRTGQDLIVDIAARHIKIIGTSQMGKSCMVAAILAQIEQTHDPDKIQIVLLDMEDRVGCLFEKSLHVARLDIGRGNTGLMHARNEEDVPVYLHYIAEELERRSKLKPHEVEELPHILVYFEEFLYVKKAIKLDGGKTCAQFLLDFDTIATRGLKLGIHMMACTQTDYADDDLKDAKAQFKTKIAFAVETSTAASAGFKHHDLVKQNCIDGIPGQFVIEAPGMADIGIAPEYDVRAKLNGPRATKVLAPKNTVVLDAESSFKGDENQSENQLEAASEAIVAELEGETWPIEHFEWKLDQLIALLHENQDEQFRQVWKVSPGPGREYKKAKAERAVLVRHMQALFTKS